MKKQTGTLVPGGAKRPGGDDFTACCVYCGGWIICCWVEIGDDPAPGDYICCFLGTSCDNGCGVCEIAF